MEPAMRKILLFVLLLVAAVPVGGAPAPLTKTTRIDRWPDLAQLQGEWLLVSEVDRAGRIHTTSDDREHWLVIGGRQCTFKTAAIEVKEARRIILYPFS